MPLKDESMDFGYSLGVLHHVPNTELGLVNCVKKLKTGAPFLVYLYYSFDNRSIWFKSIWKISDILRKFICQLPYWIKYLITQFLAVFVYLPFAKMNYILEKLVLMFTLFH